MNRKKHPAILWLVFILIGVLMLALLSVPTQAGSGLPPRAMPIPQPSDDDDKDITPDDAHIVLQVPSAPARVWAIVQ